MRRLFILVPAFIPTGPIKGAFALANALADRHSVTVVSLKPGSGADAFLDKRVGTIELSGGNVWAQRRELLRLLDPTGNRKNTSMISMCFSADLLAGLCSGHAVTCASVRGNLLQNYRMDYGMKGLILALFHLRWLRRFDHVVAMTAAMAKQIEALAGVKSRIIGNFLDEPAIDRYRNVQPRSGPLQFLFVGSLTKRKQPALLVNAVAQLREAGEDVRLDIVGDGALRARLATLIAAHGLESSITLHGQLKYPYEKLSHADVFVLPSLSEGLSRAALEASFLGMTCVMRRSDGNDEFISDGINGTLFDQDHELANAMIAAARLSRSMTPGQCHLPACFRQAASAQGYIDLIYGEK